MLKSTWLFAICAPAFLALPLASAQAQPAVTASPSPSPASTPQIAHVVTSDRRDEPLRRSARTTYVVTKAEILSHGYATVADAIETLPGVKVERDGPGASLATIGIRGSNSAQVLVLVDGIPAPGAQIDSVDLASITTNGVDRIEVVEGGGSTLYGSGSIGGVINIITTQSPGAVAQATAGSFGLQDYRIQTPYLSIERGMANENYPLPNGTTQPNSDYQISNARVAYDATFGAIAAQITGSITARQQGVVGDYTLPPLSLTSRQADVTQEANVTLSTRHRSTTTTLQLGAGGIQIAYTCDTPVDPACFNSFETPPPPLQPFASLVTESRVQSNVRVDSEHEHSNTIYGIDLAREVAFINDGFYDPAHGEFDHHVSQAFAQAAAYIQQTWTFANDDLLYAGLRGERDGWQGGAYSPAIGGILMLSPQLALKANAATAFRAPNADELYYPGFSNPNLAPERTKVGDVTIADDALLGGVALTWFSTSGSNLIIDDAVKFEPVNIGHASIAGLTLSASTPPLHGFYSVLGVTNLYRAQDLDSDPAHDPYSGMRLPRRGPVFSVNLELGYHGRPGSAIDSFALIEGVEGPRGAVNPYQPLFDQPAAYARLDAFVRVRIAKRALLTLRGYNLGNERYADVAGYPMPGRAFAVELSTLQP